ncbi:MAG: ATP-grasp domain-containing protein [Candidatus Pacebacteria bacterium]|nr:ATP-grasp domain-containing protein [Candidatus Paceibacterota bacterium]
MIKPRVGVMRGGPSPEYEVSLKTGRAVLQHVSRERYEVLDLFIDRMGVWHVRGKPVEPARALSQVDVVFNALHGKYGEDGALQRYMDMHRVRYTGSDALGSGVAMHKGLTKRELFRRSFDGESPLPTSGYRPVYVPLPARPHREAGVRGGERARLLFPADIVLSAPADAGELAGVFERLSPPLMVKPMNGGSSLGMSVVRSRDEFLYAVLFAFENAEQVLVEQYVRGREVTVAVLEDFRGEEQYAFPPVEVVPTKNSWFDYEEKYAGHARELCPAPVRPETTRALLELARHIHRTLGLRDYSRSDFILGRDGIYFLEVNTLPGLTNTSLLPRAVESVGATLPQFVDHVLTRALAR